MSKPLTLTERKRIAILDAAVAEFRLHGFDATSMDQIALRAEVSKRTVYNHFSSKDELFATMLMQLWNTSASTLDIAYQPNMPLVEQLTKIAAQKMSMLSDGNFLDLARVAIAATIHSPERAQEMIARLGEREENITLWIRSALADGKLKPLDPLFASSQLQGLLKASAFWPQVAMGQPVISAEKQRQIIDGAVHMFLACYGADGAV
ncbi:TetR/AcrR family transcriptional regulator [Solimicrobium silvestre]|uniref:Transcriptional regulator n=1 Tax=Solimicrobium silvestre TaxID=2099400 RepID=A0A2S9H1M5_9BURK|nr:TetR/AcrR family transcriptional regulator [Solimicrobium silvestre]PRC93843.1 Transcriptional regulator [Solimicrobium silvestre]